MKHSKKMGLIIALLAVVIAFASAAVAAWCMFGTQFTAAMSIEKLDNGLYSMEYIGDYGFDGFIAQGGADSDSKMADYIASFLSHGFWKPDLSKMPSADFGCSTLAVRSPEGTALFGRNYDWVNCDAMLVHTVPDNGYESISTCCLDFLGFGEDWKPEGMENQMMALAVVYVPLDGMNEKGLCIADLMAGDKAETHQKTEKPDLTTTAAIRLMLDHAATVDEALSLLAQYDINSAIGSAHHYSIMDVQGNSVVVEYVDNEMIVTETPVVTNFYITPGEKNGIGSEQSHIRYDRLMDAIRQSAGIMTTAHVREALAMVAQGTFPESDEATQWSLVYDTALLSAEFFCRENYDSGYALSLDGDWLESIMDH